jgi:hypothetical protein
MKGRVNAWTPAGAVRIVRRTGDLKGDSMPKAWSKKDERQYEHIKESESTQGRSSRRAKQIAAATVNKRRSQEGRTKEQKSGKGESKSSSAGRRSGSRSSGRGRSSGGKSSSSRSRSRRQAA